MSTHITTEPEISSGIPKVLSELDMIPVSQSVQDSIFYPVMLDGKLLGKTIIKTRNTPGYACDRGIRFVGDPRLFLTNLFCLDFTDSTSVADTDR